MKEALTLICPQCEDKERTHRLSQVLDYILSDYEVECIEFVSDFHPIKNKKVLFAICLGVSGINVEYYRFLKKVRTDRKFFEGCVGGIIVDGESELFTKSIAREATFAANQAGCTFPGRSMVEGTGSLANFDIQAMIAETDLFSAYKLASKRMLENLMTFSVTLKKRPHLLVLHASNHITSNTAILWRLLKYQLEDCDITEISLRNGTVQDCSGCPYKMCLHYSKRESCYYGGVISDEVYPAVLDCDALILLCPNYNDALSANLTAFVNRLTALFRRTPFYDKWIFALIVSGYSGGNIVAEQVISALNMNKTFRLPPRFAMIETANNPESILDVDGIYNHIHDFAVHINTILVAEENAGENE